MPHNRPPPGGVFHLPVPTPAVHASTRFILLMTDMSADILLEMHMKDNINIVGFISFVGAFLMILSVILHWGAVEIPLLNMTSSFSGWDVYQGHLDLGPLEASGFEVTDITSYDYAPLFMIAGGILGFVSLVLRLGPMAKRVKDIASLVTLIVSIAAIAVAVLFNNDLANYDLFGMLTAEPSYGIWVGVAGGVLTIVGCVGCILKKEPRYSDGMEYGMEP